MKFIANLIMILIAYGISSLILSGFSEAFLIVLKLLAMGAIGYSIYNAIKD